jgi:hypothetical protein
MLVFTPLLVSTHYQTSTAEMMDMGKQWGLPLITMATQVSSNLP